MEEIIKPVSKELLKAELTEDRRLRMTNKSNNQIYIITHQNAPNVMREIGRLREIAFRAAGGGTGLSMDIDEYDTMEHPYKQLIVWNPEAEEILGGYRYLLGTDVRFDEAGAPILATSHMFHFSDAFIKEYLPQTIELGRSFVTLEYQSTRAGSKGLFALDNLWDGLGALTVVMPNVKYFFGKVTMYPSYHRRGRDMILYFLKKHFNDREELVTPMEPLILETSDEELRTLFCKDTFKEDYKILNTEKYQYLIYSFDYGIELIDLYGEPVSYVCSELKRRITEALIQDDRIESVDNFTFELNEPRTIYAKFLVHTIFGNIEEEKVVSF